MYLLTVILLMFFVVPAAILIARLVNYLSSNPAKKAKGKWFLMIACC